MQDPKNLLNKSKHVLNMINKYNMNDLNLADRPVNSRREGFGSILP